MTSKPISCWFYGGPHAGRMFPLKRTPPRIPIKELGGVYRFHDSPHFGPSYAWTANQGRKAVAFREE